MYTKFKCCACVLLIGLGGCHLTQPSRPAPVISLPIKAEHVPLYHVVKPGESLYTIAWIYDLDAQKIARINRISLSETIYPKQKIYLKQMSSSSVASPATAKVLKKPVAPSNIELKLPKRENHSTEKSAEQAHEKWIWPVKGKVEKLFSNKQNDYNKGIDISGKLNATVVAAKSGKVVYSGEGLRGYGKLIIIKHDENYLSAYAHNNQLLVNEGDTIKQGAAIAMMGQTDSPTVKLHFQIRKNGQPVDPSHYLH